MDPQATLYDLLEAIDRNDREAVDELLEALQEWNRKGGFLPQVDTIPGIDGMVRVFRNRKQGGF